MINVLAQTLKDHPFVGWGRCKCGWVKPDVFEGPMHRDHVAQMQYEAILKIMPPPAPPPAVEPVECCWSGCCEVCSPQYDWSK